MKRPSRSVPLKKGVTRPGKIIVFALSVVSGCILAVFRAYALTPAMGTPDLLLIYLLAVACFYDGTCGAVTALVAGVIADVLTGAPVCCLCLFYTLAAVFPDIFGKTDKRARAVRYFVSCGLFSVGELFPTLAAKIFGAAFSSAVFSCIWQTALCGAVLGSLVILFTATGRRLRS